MTLDEDIETLRGLVSKYLWADERTRSLLEVNGINLTRADFYSESPTIAEIDQSFEYDGAGTQLSVYDDPLIFDVDQMDVFARSLSPFLAGFDPALDDDGSSRFYWRNEQFSYSDAAALFALVVSRRPKNIIEIGSGHSTRLASEALALTGGGRIVCVDPEPRAEVARLPGVEFIRQPVQSISPDFFRDAIAPGDFVFYDGSHTIKSGSDTVFFYLSILPYLPVGTLVHAHDVSLPFATPKANLIHRRMNWGEQYILMAHLHNRTRYKVLLANALLRKRRPDALDELMNGKFESGGQSLWYEVVDTFAKK
ncbi:class I SAM-dependent methyltransferase [Mesorhizobium sp. BR1-1-3]|uniref:class I SAM-dependent methyltransferase n=1 Tax=Mesorhizobium sp. BR1-1-3 TaxID=2876651 RepID=UPI001CD18DBF|nr:class I SAM-dependent methyltransferase [Mesorhizobium sp. BR1-1-3]MBZ9888584.1 class I SAM-dependent methyltransferase [Mesorhizobium sp. BR1-1-3]